MTYLEQMQEYQDYSRAGLQPGKFRLVTFDDFCAPPEPCVIGEAANLEAAKRFADS
jgi:hypothetical protein